MSLDEDVIDRRRDAFFWLIFAAGMVTLALGVAWGHIMMIPMGASFIMASVVGTYMMHTTKNVAHKIYGRFDEQSGSLEKMNKRAEEFQRQNAESFKDITNTLVQINESQERLSKSQEEISKSIKDSARILDRIDKRTSGSDD